MSLYTLPLGVEVANGFARGFQARFGGEDPLLVARSTIYANTPRALRRIEAALAEAADGSALLPRLRVLGDLGADPLALPGLPAAPDPLRRHLRLIRLVEGYLRATGGSGPPPAAAPALAEGLAGLLDELDEAGLDGAALHRLAAAPEAETHAAHWQQLLGFVEIVTEAWPAIRAEAEGGAPDPKARQRLAVAAQLAAWEAAPPAEPVIAAGSTGAVGTTAELMAAIARLPRGAVVLPGLDAELPDAVWDEIAAGRAPEHPQAPFANILTRLGCRPADAVPWVETPPPVPARARLLREAFRPAPVTDAWIAAAPALAAEAEAAVAGLGLVEAGHPREEAGAIAVAIRQALEVPGRHVALVTPDAALARRVTAELARFAVLPDDSLGRPLAGTPPAVFLRLIAEVAAGAPDPVRLAGLLGHPLMRAGRSRAAHLALARRYERKVLRAHPALEAAPGTLPPWPEDDAAAAALAEDETPEAERWRAEIAAALAPLVEALAAGAPLAALVAALVQAAEALSRDAPEAEPLVWQRSAGAAVHALVQRLAGHADAHGEAPVAAFPALLAELLGQAELRPDPAAPHPRVSILGPREARTHPADLVILAGLTEGTWPALPAPDPWLSRPMRAALGLPSPEARIGLAAHDLAHALHRAEVLLTRPARRDGAPALPSRWLVRLENLLAGLDGGAALDAMRARGAALVTAARTMHRPAATLPPATRPRPSPPASARPRKLSVTDVETLVADPYAIYAKRVLRLLPLDPLGRPPGAIDRGQVLHKVFERFVAETADALPEPAEAAARLVATADAVLAEEIPWPDRRRLWRGRIARVAGWFVGKELERRAAGAPALREAAGRHRLATPAGMVELTARADRIDLCGPGAAVYDYKAGQPPSPKQIAAGRNQQLHIQAAMLAAGGFKGIAPLPALRGAYIGLAGKEEPVENLDETVTEHMAHLAELLGHYLTDTPFVARARPDLAHEEGDYDHLSRRAEWDPSL
ncbi:double-strand break repair protein AddB [Paralimibaculum aggregatum]|uniref:Double-strand break repair protein AddB n=1 Tax=Paralimibaculum aggregatum TaxID=3036245 RepID=A0ABQ6LKX6_9RHOB|nr:double-strand break repair protein AddB [Limibaculum sp. NKW23]GMG82914.1 double-strand break repair protein AddB [Limibaculum sp. NKW23]